MKYDWTQLKSEYRAEATELYQAVYLVNSREMGVK